MNKANKILYEAGIEINEKVIIKKGQTVLFNKDGKQGKIISLSGDKSIATVEYSNGNYVDITVDQFSKNIDKNYDLMVESSINEQKLSSHEYEFIIDELKNVTSDNFSKYAKKNLLKDMKDSVGDDSFDSKEAKIYILQMTKSMATHINKFTG